jgi:hypothetical protein
VSRLRICIVLGCRIRVCIQCQKLDPDPHKIEKSGPLEALNGRTAKEIPKVIIMEP